MRWLLPGLVSLLRCSYIVMQNWLKKWMYGQGRCVQGNHTKHTHTGNLAYAFDFKLKPGTKVRSSSTSTSYAVRTNTYPGTWYCFTWYQVFDSIVLLVPGIYLPTGTILESREKCLFFFSHNTYSVSLLGLKNRHGHWLCWMPTGRKNGLM